MKRPVLKARALNSSSSRPRTVSDITPELRTEIENCDLLFLDGTFWNDDELQRTRGGGASAREMGHLPISGPDGSLAQLASLRRPRKVYIHINNTNPILDEDSAQHRQVRDAGWEIAEDGMEVML